MKLACAISLIAVLTISGLGCAKKANTKPKAQAYVTKDCVVGFVKASKCEALPNTDLAICRDVILKLACVRVSK